MRKLIDAALATGAEVRLAQLWATYAVTHYGAAAVDRLNEGFRDPANGTSRRVLRMAVRQAEARLRRTICIATLPVPTPARIAGC